MRGVQGTLRPSRAYRHCPPRSAVLGAATASQLHPVTLASGFREKDKNIACICKGERQTTERALVAGAFLGSARG